MGPPKLIAQPLLDATDQAPLPKPAPPLTSCADLHAERGISLSPQLMCTHPGLCLYVLPQQPLLVEGVPGLPCNGVDGTLVNLLFDGTDQQEERLSNCLLGKGKKTKSANWTWW